MAAIGDAASKYLQSAVGAYTPITSAYSWCFWYYPTSDPASGGASKHPFALTNSTGGTPNGYDVSFAWDHNNPSFYKSAYHRAATGTFYQAQHPGTPAKNAWHHIAATYNGTNLILYYDGIAVATTAATPPGNTFGSPELTVCSYGASTGYDDHLTAEHAIWSTALTAAEILSIRNGASPSAVQSGSLVSYSKVNTADLTTAGPALTNSGATVNTTYFQGHSGGIVLGGSQGAKTIYNWTNSGGIVLGGTQQLTQRVSWATVMTISEADRDVPFLTTPMTISSDLALPSSFGAISNKMLIGSSFVPATVPILAGNRSNAITSR